MGRHCIWKVDLIKRVDHIWICKGQLAWAQLGVKTRFGHANYDFSMQWHGIGDHDEII